MEKIVGRGSWIMNDAILHKKMNTLGLENKELWIMSNELRTIDNQQELIEITRGANNE